jgi:hypothetical protein
MDIETASELYYNYFKYKENILTKRRIRHSEISQLINKLDDKIFHVTKQGESYSGRDINLITAGKGEKKIFMWSQMHGDESTATMALFDIFNFLSVRDGFDSLRQKIFNNVSLYFLPMVNPDGAEEFKRENYLDIDINRDAIRMQTPEGKILRNTFDMIKADFGFNLHDQNIRYTAGNSYKTATISFLAPLFDQGGSINVTRGNAIKTIGSLARIISNYIPGHIARYEEDFEPRSFGDTFQGLGTSTILIESGGWKDDNEKQFIRKINFILLISAILIIIDKDYEKESFELYNNLSFNKEYLYDLVLRNLKIKNEDKISLIDIGINNNEDTCGESDKNKVVSNIEEIGDLSNIYGNEEFDLDDYLVESSGGKLKKGVAPNIQIKKGRKIKYTITKGNLINPSQD